jgi:hypothetical protein
MALLWVAQ